MGRIGLRVVIMIVGIGIVTMLTPRMKAGSAAAIVATDIHVRVRVVGERVTVTVGFVRDIVGLADRTG